LRVTIRPHRESDRPVLLGFIRALQEAERAMHPSRLPGEAVTSNYYRSLLRRNAEILIAELDGAPVGFVAGWVDVDDDPLQTMEWRRHGWISDVFVAEPCRGRGIAQQLLRAMSERLRERGATRLRICALAANAPSIAAFRSFGFAPFEVTFDKPLAPAT
jgi:ribosomal protein S18 acetylase RimI-like enzyme